MDSKQVLELFEEFDIQIDALETDIEEVEGEIAGNLTSLSNAVISLKCEVIEIKVKLLKEVKESELERLSRD